MKILMLNYEFPPLGGGGSPVSYEIAKGYVRAGHKVDVVTMGFKGLPDFEVRDGINIYRIKCWRKKKEICTTPEMLSYVISARYFLKKHLKEHKYDINHTHFIIPTGIVSLWVKKKFGIPYIITSHGSDVLGYNPDRFKLQHILVKPLWNKIVKNAKCITTPTKYLKNLILEGTNYNKIEVIPNGIHPENFTPKKKDKKILVVSRLFERKGIQYVIEAMKDIKDYKLVICGAGPYKEQLEKQINRLNLDNVCLLGYVSEEKLKYEYETSSIFVLSSSAENFPVVLLEAMSAGCAIITTNVTGCPEAVGDAALLVNPKNSEEIHKALLKLIENDKLRNELSLKARNRVEEKFDWENVIKKYEMVLENA